MAKPIQAWAQARFAKAAKSPAEVKNPLPKKVEEKKAPAAAKAPKTPRQWHDDREAHNLPEETWHGHFDKHPDKGGKPSDARREMVHAPIIADAFRGKKPVPAGQKKIAIMTMGAPASGKSSGLRGIDTSKFVLVDPDGIKEKIPEYKRATEDRSKTYKKAALMAHEESSALAKEITKRAIDDGHHVLIDGTGANKESFEKKMKQLQDKGYHVHVIASHLHEEEGVARAKVRAENTGRDVPEKVIRDAYKAVPKNFLSIVKKADTAHVVDNRGKGGRLVWSKDEDGTEHHHDPVFVNAFHATHGGDGEAPMPLKRSSK